MTRQFLIDNAKRFCRNTKRFYPGHLARAMADEVISFLILGASPDDYYRYAFYKKSWHERNQFITYRRSKRLIAQWNRNENSGMMHDKRLLNQALKPYLCREWLDLSSADEQSFRRFLERHSQILMKPYNGSGGKGIFILGRSESDDLNDILERSRNYIAEELLKQHPDLEALNPSSVNTIRILMFKGQVLSATLKVGQAGSVVDNMCSNGLYGNIDLSTGITDSHFLDIELNPHLIHPDTGKTLIGVQIPRWNEILETVNKANELLSDVDYIGWDVAVLKDRVAVIEANDAPGHDLSAQSSVQRGLYSRIKG